MNDWLDGREFADLMFAFRNQRGNGEAIAGAFLDVVEFIRKQIVEMEDSHD